MTELATLASQSKMWKSSASALTSGMSRLGVKPDIMQTMVGSIQLFSGIAQMGSVASGILGMLRTASTAEAVAMTGEKVAEGPTGWAAIATALAVSGAIGTAIGYWASECNLTINTDSPSELKMVAGMARR